MEKFCEGCGATRPRPGAGPYDRLDYCAECSRDLCDRCMAQGCCDHVPARSGLHEDCGEDDLGGEDGGGVEGGAAGNSGPPGG